MRPCRVVDEGQSIEPGAVIDRRYEVLYAIGHGGMGSVYAVKHLLTEHVRALKVLHPAQAAIPEVRERFLREASAAGRIGSPWIAETLDAGITDDGQAFLVMELLKGETLRAYLGRYPHGLPESEIAALFSNIAAGVQAAHDGGFVHRDLKPENVFVVTNGAERVAKILDFGISRSTETTTDLTATGSLLGTPLYMAPEQLWAEKNIDARADVYALGLILHEMFTGAHPYKATSMAGIVHGATSGELSPPSTQRTGLAPVVDAVVLRARAVSRNDRFASVAEFARAFTSAMAASETHARSQPPTSDFALAATVAKTGTLARETSLALADTAVGAAGQPNPKPRSSSWLLALGIVVAATAVVTLALRETQRPGPEPVRATSGTEEPAPTTSQSSNLGSAAASNPTAAAPPTGTPTAVQAPTATRVAPSATHTTTSSSVKTPPPRATATTSPTNDIVRSPDG